MHGPPDLARKFSSHRKTPGHTVQTRQNACGRDDLCGPMFERRETLIVRPSRVTILLQPRRRCAASLLELTSTAAISALMARYRFNLEDHRFIADRGIHDCFDEEHAREIADELADRLVQTEPDLVFGGHAIVVRDEHDRQIYRAEMDHASVVKRGQN
jgi:hypothetical protein